MAVAIADAMHVVGTLARAGILRPSRPDSALRAIVGLRRHLARYKVPREVVFVDELPRNATGKVVKRQLQ